MQKASLKQRIDNMNQIMKEKFKFKEEHENNN